MVERTQRRVVENKVMVEARIWTGLSAREGTSWKVEVAKRDRCYFSESRKTGTVSTAALGIRCDGSF